MVSRLEKYWKNCNQQLFLLTLILNAFEMLLCFGPDANLDHFKCTNIPMSLYLCMMAQSSNNDSTELQKEKEHTVSKAFMHYPVETEKFSEWKNNREEFIESMARRYTLTHQEM